MEKERVCHPPLTMTVNASRADGMVVQIENLFRGLVADLPPGRASIEVQAGKDATVIKLVPASPDAAPLSAAVPVDERRGVTLIAGRGSYFEIPVGGRRYTQLDLLGEIKAISKAVISGTLSEEVTFDGDEVLRGIGVIDLSRLVRIRWRRISFRPWRRTSRRQFRYEPY